MKITKKPLSVFSSKVVQSTAWCCGTWVQAELKISLSVAINMTISMQLLAQEVSSCWLPE